MKPAKKPGTLSTLGFAVVAKPNQVTEAGRRARALASAAAKKPLHGSEAAKASDRRAD